MRFILITALVISVISGILAILLTLSNKYIANYGKIKVTVNDETVFVSDGGETLMEILKSNGVQIPSVCGGKGTCRMCKVKVVGGLDEALPTEIKGLTPEEIEDGYRLSCMTKVFGDILIELPENLLGAKQYECIVEDIESITGEGKLVKLKIPEGNGFDSKPGQYIQFFTPIYEYLSTETVKNYSIISSSLKTECIELLSIKESGDTCENFIHNYLKVGDTVKITGPHGDFYYQNSKNKILMAFTEGGLGSIKAMLEYIRENKIENEVFIILMSQTENELYEKMIINEYEDINIIPNLCSLGEDEECTNKITNYIENNDVSNMDIYLCGAKDVINPARQLLIKSGVSNDKIKYQYL